VDSHRYPLPAITQRWGRSRGSARKVAVSLLTVAVCGGILAWGRHSNTPSTKHNQDRQKPTVIRITSVSVLGNFQVTNDGAEATYTFSIRNDGERALLITFPGPSTLPPGTTMNGASASSSVASVNSGRSQSLTLSFHIDDCRKVPKASWPIIMQARERGSESIGYVTIDPPGEGAASWQQTAVSQFCKSQP
jgi:hypothetical protein